MLVFPARFVRIQTDLHGPDGLVWVRRLPAILNDCVRRWDLTLGATLEPLTYNYLVSAYRRDGTPVIVKVCSPGGEFRLQAHALRHFDGRGAVRLLASDERDEVMLLERCEPGTLLHALDDDAAATTIAASVMRQLWHPLPPDHPFPSITDWGRGFARLRQHYGGTGPFPAALVERAERLFADLSGSMAAPVLLHGDLHHDNILAAQRQPWLAIDPKGVAGEPAYETGALLRNPLNLLDFPHPGHILARRVDQLAGELDLDRARVRDWGIAQAVLSAWWTVEDHGRPSAFALAVATLLAEIKI
jgi:streptomycin 6-kinase